MKKGVILQLDMKKSNCCDYYDDPEFDYRDYWIGREYEDLAERQVLEYLYRFIGKKPILMDLGGGYGRLVSTYRSWFKKAVLVEPSEKNIKEAKGEAKKWKDLKLVHGTAEDLKLKAKSIDVGQMVRVAHHCQSLEVVFGQVYRVLKPGGWFILEFPNKIHALMTLRSWLKLNFGFRADLSSIDRRACWNQKKETICFMNHHPVQVLKWLDEAGFEVKKTFSVSNLRRLKFIPTALAVRLDRLFWGLVRPVWWGPSIFVLGRKTINR